MDARAFEDEAVAAERAFARRAAREGISAAFLAVLAEDAIVLGEAGPAPGPEVYREPVPGLLQWEPAAVAVAPDGTLACTAGPYRYVDAQGQERGRGVYFSVWRRSAGGSLELVLDIGCRGAAFPGTAYPGAARPELLRLPVPAGPPLEVSLRELPVLPASLRLGEPASAGVRPLGFHRSRDGALGALWGATTPPGGGTGAFVVLVGAGLACPGPVALASMNV